MSPLVINCDAWIMRAYKWLWGADPRQANFCKLLWAFVFAPLALVVLKPLRFVRRRKATGKGLDRVEGFAGRHPRIGQAYGLFWPMVWLVWIVWGFINDPILIGATFAVIVVAAWLLRRPGNALEKFGTFLMTGYRAVKTRTCPRIELRDRDRP